MISCEGRSESHDYPSPRRRPTDNVPVGTGEIYESDRPATAPLVSSLESFSCALIESYPV